MAIETGDNFDHHRGVQPLLHGGPWRAVLFVGINLLLFAAVNVFRTYLATGQWSVFSTEAYYRDVFAPLGESLLHPLSVLFHPWMILVTGLLLAAALLTPIITAVLYPLPIALLFLAVVAVLGHAPVLAVVLAAGCVTAARTPLRSDASFLAFVLGLLPGAVYLYFFGLGDAQSLQVLPLQRWVLAGPLLIAVVAAVVAAAGVLAIARATRFRAGVIFPALMIFLAVPAALFYTRIGPDELDYELLVGPLTPGDLVLAPATLDAPQGQNEAPHQANLRQTMQRRAGQLIETCDRFLERHGRSSRAASVLWIRAQCQSLELDVPAVQAGTVRYSAVHVRAGSAPTWRHLAEQHARAPQAALARWRLGQLALRRRETAEAERQLLAAEEALARHLAARRAAAQSSDGRLFRPRSSLPSQGYYVEALFRVRHLLWLMDRNDVVNDPAAAEALAAMLNESPLTGDYFQRLGRLVALYERTRLGDNLKLAAALAIDDPYAQADMLMLLAEDERTDAAVEANYQLGMLTMQTARAVALPLMPNLKRPAEYFQTVIAAPPNPWQGLAREHLARLGLAAGTLARRP